MELRAVFFDLDGVLINSSSANLKLRQCFASDFGYGTNIDINLDTENTDDLIEHILTTYDSDIKCSDFQKYAEKNMKEYIQNVVQNPDAKHLLDLLDAKGILSAVVTNSESALARKILEAKNLIPNILVGLDGQYRKKPAPDMIFRACELLGVPPWEIMYVGDSESDFHAAMAAGCLFVGFGISGNFTISKLMDVLDILAGAGPSN